MQCNNCGHELAPGSEFCGNCGAKLINAAPAAQPASVSPQPVVASQPTVEVAQPTAVPTPALVEAPIVSTPPPPPPPIQPAPAAQPGAYAVPKQPSSGMSITSMVLGICSLVLFLLWFLAIPLAIMALIFGFVGRSKGGAGMALAGIITGGIAILLAVLFIAAIFSNPDKFNEVETSKTSQFLAPGLLIFK